MTGGQVGGKRWTTDRGLVSEDSDSNQALESPAQVP